MASEEIACFEVPPTIPLSKVEAWRKDGFEKVGFPEREAEVLACTPYADLHDCSRMVQAGCSLELAYKILI